MKKRLFLIAAAASLFLLCGCTAAGEPKASDTAAAAVRGMQVKSSGIADGVMDDKYGKRGELDANGVPVVSPPLTIVDAPEGTVSFAVYMDDPDAKPLAGYNWAHWMAANITQSELPEDFSRNADGKAVQGENDFGQSGYGGPTPPDRDHTYIMAVYALDSKLPLKEGFSKSEFEQAIDGHVLASATLSAMYRK